MLNLNDREWKAFKVKHIFSIEKCKCSSVSTLKQGTFPYVGATNRNNGIMSFVEKRINGSQKETVLSLSATVKGRLVIPYIKKKILSAQQH